MKKLSFKDDHFILTKRDLKSLYLYVYEIGRQNGVLMEAGIGQDNTIENLNQFMAIQETPKAPKFKQSYVDRCPFFYDQDLQDEWKDFADVRRRKKCSTSDKAIHTILNELMEFSESKKEVAIAIIRQSHMSGYPNVYKLKTQKNDNKPKQSREEIWRNSY